MRACRALPAAAATRGMQVPRCSSTSVPPSSLISSGAAGRPPHGEQAVAGADGGVRGGHGRRLTLAAAHFPRFTGRNRPRYYPGLHTVRRYGGFVWHATLQGLIQAPLQVA